MISKLLIACQYINLAWLEPFGASNDNRVDTLQGLTWMVCLGGSLVQLQVTLTPQLTRAWLWFGRTTLCMTICLILRRYCYDSISLNFINFIHCLSPAYVVSTHPQCMFDVQLCMCICEDMSLAVLASAFVTMCLLHRTYIIIECIASFVSQLNW